MAKPKVAIYWCASCGGCEEVVVDLNETLLKVADMVDIVLWPVALDFKKKDIEALKDGEIAVSLINGAIRLSEQEEWAKLLRRKSKLVVAFGSCACFGGIPGLANLYSREDIIERAYQETPSTVNPEKTRPQLKTHIKQGELELPEFWESVKTLDQVIKVDYYLPGCAPATSLVGDALMAIVSGKLPPLGSTLAPAKSLCDVCPRRATKPERLTMTEVKRPMQIKMDEEKCFLAQNVICMGPATRAGCGETCIRGNQPCRGCFGPVAGIKDQGAKAVSMIASILGVENEDQLSDEEVEALLNQVVDPAGLFYRFTLPASMLKRKKVAAAKK
jgi:F420-non-reducing hydrogenase small subunit